MTERTMLIIGNGFDLYCGLPSRYKDYFEYKNNNNIYFKNFYMQLRDLDMTKADRFFGKPYNQISVMQNINDNFTVWDIMFLMVEWDRGMKGSNWCDIEKLMSMSLHNVSYIIISDFLWIGVLNVINEIRTSLSFNPMLARAVDGAGTVEEITAYILLNSMKFQKRFNDLVISVNDFYLSG